MLFGAAQAAMAQNGLTVPVAADPVKHRPSYADTSVPVASSIAANLDQLKMGPSDSEVIRQQEEVQRQAAAAEQARI